MELGVGLTSGKFTGLGSGVLEITGLGEISMETVGALGETGTGKLGKTTVGMTTGGITTLGVTTLGVISAGINFSELEKWSGTGDRERNATPVFTSIALMDVLYRLGSTMRSLSPFIQTEPSSVFHINPWSRLRTSIPTEANHRSDKIISTDMSLSYKFMGVLHDVFTLVTEL